MDPGAPGREEGEPRRALGGDQGEEEVGLREVVPGEGAAAFAAAEGRAPSAAVSGAVRGEEGVVQGAYEAVRHGRAGGGRGGAEQAGHRGGCGDRGGGGGSGGRGAGGCRGGEADEQRADRCGPRGRETGGVGRRKDPVYFPGLPGWPSLLFPFLDRIH